MSARHAGLAGPVNIAALARRPQARWTRRSLYRRGRPSQGDQTIQGAAGQVADMETNSGGPGVSSMPGGQLDRGARRRKGREASAVPTPASGRQRTCNCTAAGSARLRIERWCATWVNRSRGPTR